MARISELFFQQRRDSFTFIYHSKTAMKSSDIDVVENAPCTRLLTERFKFPQGPWFPVRFFGRIIGDPFVHTADLPFNSLRGVSVAAEMFFQSLERLKERLHVLVRIARTIMELPF